MLVGLKLFLAVYNGLLHDANGIFNLWFVEFVRNCLDWVASCLIAAHHQLLSGIR